MNTAVKAPNQPPENTKIQEMKHGRFVGVGCLLFIASIVVSSCVQRPAPPTKPTWLEIAAQEQEERHRKIMEGLRKNNEEVQEKLEAFRKEAERLRACDVLSKTLADCEARADGGDVVAMRKLFDAYSSGTDVPKNVERATKYLGEAVNAGAEWAQLLVASRLEGSDREKALVFYLGLARRDNCHAQTRLARAFYAGDLTDRNPTQAYFWTLLAQAGGPRKMSEYHPLTAFAPSRLLPHEKSSLAGAAKEFNTASGKSTFLPCAETRRQVDFQGQLESSLAPELLRLTQDEATKWSKGQLEPTLPAAGVAIGSPGRRDPQPNEPPRSTEPPKGTSRPPADRPAPTPPLAPPKPSAPPQVAARPPDATAVPRWPQWTPLPAATMLARTTGSGDLASLFATVSRSVWLVLAARSAADLEAGTGVAVGSAVAVNLNALLTNCHVIGDRAFVWIKQGETIVESTVVHGDRETDRCILAAPKATLRPVPGMRRYNDLRVGESVYTIGSPRGLERSLGQGIISGLRQREQQRLIQTTAQISPGSSGGGLFDQDGNLLGLTTFRLKDSEGLNFAIALDEFFRP